MESHSRVFGVVSAAMIAMRASAGDVPFLERHIDSHADGVGWTVAADIDGDGDMDVVAASRNDDTIAWYENQGGSPPQWTKHIIASTADGAFWAAAIDFDGDGDLDVIGASSIDGVIAWFENDGASPPTWSGHVVFVSTPAFARIRPGDLDGDGDIDLVVTRTSPSTIGWLRNDGGAGPTFTYLPIVSVSGGLGGIVLSDLDDDGDLDILSASNSSPQRWYENQGMRPLTFVMRIIAVHEVGQAIGAADLDGDGDNDIIIGYNGGLLLYLNMGGSPPSFKQVPSFTPYTYYTSSIAFSDVNGDGDLEVITSHSQWDTVAWHESDGASPPSFARHDISSSVVAVGNISVPDFDGDGDNDVLVSSSQEDRISWFENTPLRKLPTQSLHVPGDFATIQGAIDAAPPLAEIVVADGVHSGPGNFNISFLGKQITVRSSGGAERCTIDCRHAGRAFVFDHAEGPDSMIDGFTIINGLGPGGGLPFSPVGGGAISMSQSSPIIRNCVFRSNATMPLGGFGGAISIGQGAPTIEDCLFESNTAAGGGALQLFATQAVPIRRCRFIANQAGGSGGAICMNYFSSANLLDCVIFDNTASDGGAIALNFSIGISMTNSLVTDNHALVDAAVVSALESSVNATNCTIVGNTAPPGKSSFILDGVASLGFGNCIVWDNPTPLLNSHILPGCTFCFPIPASYSIIQGGWSTGQSIIDADPVFVDPDRGDYRLAAGSPAIDAGRNSLVPAGVTTDFAGQPRFVDDPRTPDTGLGTPPIVDMGAYEFQTAPVDCAADINCDGVVNTLDLGILLSSWSIPPSAPGCGGARPCLADLNHDGFVNSLDLGILLSSWTL